MQLYLIQSTKEYVNLVTNKAISHNFLPDKAYYVPYIVKPYTFKMPYLMRHLRSGGTSKIFSQLKKIQLTFTDRSHLSTCSVDHVIDHDCHFSFHISNQIHDLHNVLQLVGHDLT